VAFQTVKFRAWGKPRVKLNNGGLLQIYYLKFKGRRVELEVDADRSLLRVIPHQRGNWTLTASKSPCCYTLSVRTALRVLGLKAKTTELKHHWVEAHNKTVLSIDMKTLRKTRKAIETQ